MSNQEDDKDKIDSVDSEEIVSQQSKVNENKNRFEELKSEADLDFGDLPEEAQAVMKMVLNRKCSILQNKIMKEYLKIQN